MTNRATSTETDATTEAKRLNFVLERDGKNAAVEFAARTFAKYRECLRMDGRNGRKLHHASLPQYRRGFVESCLEFRRFLRGQG